MHQKKSNWYDTLSFPVILIEFNYFELESIDDVNKTGYLTEVFGGEVGRIGTVKNFDLNSVRMNRTITCNLQANKTSVNSGLQYTDELYGTNR